MKLRFLLFSCCFLLWTSQSMAQISYGGTPTSFGSNFQASELAKESLTVYLIPALDMDAIKVEDAKGGNRAGAATPVAISLEKEGLWQTLPNQDRLWRMHLKVQTPEVSATRFMFDAFKLPEGAKLFIYTPDHKVVLGAFTSENNHESGVFATTLVKGREVMLEYYEPAAVKGQTVLNINRIDQAYRNIALQKKSKLRSSPQGFGDAGSCNIDINCSPLTTDWQDEKCGVVRILIASGGGFGFCSGSIINNTANNHKPYLLTANHCAEGVSASFFNQWVFDFNYEITDCDNINTEPSPQSMTGASMVSNGADSDFYLLLLNQNIPASYNAYFNGWNRANTLPTNTTGIHHPAGDVKMFCNDEQAPVSANGAGDTVANGDFLKVVWNNGITEGGSSGSPLFDSNGRIVGQLFAGSSFCSNTTGPDWYGKVSSSWLGMSSSLNSLSNWLDPLNTGVTFLNGKNNGTPIYAKFTSSVQNVTYLPSQITFTNSSVGATSWSWNFGAGATPATANTAGPHVVSYATSGVKLITLTINGGTDVTIREIAVMPTLSAEYTPSNGGDFESNDTHFFGLSGFQKGNSTISGKNGVASGNNAYVTWRTKQEYPEIAETYLYTPNFNFSLAGSYTIQFKTKYQSELTRDGFIVQYSTNRGTSWTQLGNVIATGWYNASVVNGGGSFIGGTRFFSGSASTFETKSFVATNLGGNANVAFRFVFKSDETDNAAGVAIDDFQIIPPFGITNFVPANNSTNVVIGANLQVTFNKNVIKGTGNIVLKRVNDNTVIETIDVASALVTVANNIVTINPTNDFAQGTQVFIEMGNSVFKDENNIFATGITGNTAWRFTTNSDLVVPTLVSISPANNATFVQVNTNLMLTLNENVKKGTGNITIKRLSDNTIVEQFASTSPNVTIANAVVTINPSNNLGITTGYYVEVDNGAIQDLASNNYAGFTGNTTWRFTTDTETAPPTALSFNPINSAINVTVTTNLSITFDEPIKKGTSGNILIKKLSDNSVVESIVITNTIISVAGAVLTINPENNFLANTSYYIEISSGVIQDIAGNNYAGFTGNNTWGFITLDNIAPTLVSLSPTNNASNIVPSTNLVMTFSENIKKGATGNILIKKASDNTVFATIGIATTNVSILGAVLTINPSNDLIGLTDYYVEIPNTVVEDLASNTYAGFLGNTTWKFGTAQETTPPSPISFSPNDNTINFAGTSNLNITFNEPIAKGATGSIIIKKLSNNAIVETIEIGSLNATITNATLTINPINDLIFNTTFYVEITAGAIQDMVGNTYDGFTGAGIWRFSTDFSTAIEDENTSKAFVIYPNPSEKITTLQVKESNFLQKTTLRLLDMTGKVIWTKTIQLLDTQLLDLDRLKTGKYLLEIQTSKGIVIKAIIKQ